MTAHLQATCPEVCCHPSQDLKVALQPGAVSQCDAVVPRPWRPPVHDVLSLLVLQLIPRPGGNAAIHILQGDIAYTLDFLKDELKLLNRADRD